MLLQKGVLILADTLSCAVKQYKPDATIDIATLVINNIKN